MLCGYKTVKLKFHGSSFPRSIRDIFARMSLTSHKKIGVSDVSDEDATRILARSLARMSRGCYAECGPVEFKLYAAAQFDCVKSLVFT